MKFCRMLPRAAAVAALWAVLVSGAYSFPARRLALPDISRAPLASCTDLGRMAASDEVGAALILPLRNPAALQGLLANLSNPASPEYGRYLSPEQFAADFAPTPPQYQEAETFARSQGLVVTATHGDRLILDIAGSRTAIESAFGVRMNWYRRPSGRVIHAPDRAPSIPESLEGIVAGVVGLSNANLRHGFLVPRAAGAHSIGGSGIGTGTQGGLAPSDIRAAYNIPASGLTGSGQTLAAFELDGYTPSDITGYEHEFGLPNTPLDNVLVDNATGAAGSGADEVTLDIEMLLALGSGADKIMVYEAPNTDTGMLDCYARIADDDAAREISTSWGLAEPDNSSGFLQSENAIFEQMAAQGQTIFAASGDNGAYDTGSRSDGLTVDDPGSQPYVCSAGATTLTTASAGGPWAAETTWNSGSIQGGASGGGASSVWPIPSWQQSAITSPSLASTTMRNVPDVSIDADPNTGYSIYFQGTWAVYGGTSCSAPLWAGLTALVNQERVSDGKPVIGQASPALYQLLPGAGYDSDFHDIADGSTNLYYPAVTGFDDATGLGTPNGAGLISALVSEAGATTDKPGPPAGLTAFGGTNSISLTWSAGSGATSYDIYRSTVSGADFASIGTAASPTFTDTSAAPGTLYYYVVTSVDAAGQSADSNQASAAAIAPLEPPAAPTNLVASAGNGSVALSWTASSGATAYSVYRAPAGGLFAQIGSSATTAYTDSSVTNGQTYDYAVAAVDSGGRSGQSNVAVATPTAPLPVLATFPAGLAFISLPYGYSGVPLSSIFGYADPTLAVWNPASGSYAVTPTAPADEVAVGRGYWVRFPQAAVVTLPGTPAALSAAFPIALTTGWNQIGDPFPTAAALSSCSVVQGSKTYSYDEAVASGLIGGLVYGYDTGSGSYTTQSSTGALDPDEGYWIEAYSDVTLEVSPP